MRKKNKYEIIEIKCPKCKKTKRLGILEKVVKEIGLTIFSVPYLTCDHTFQVFIDKDFKVRGYQKDDCSLTESNENFVQIRVECPECGQSKVINLEKVSLNDGGITTINIHPEFVCKHAIRVFIDRNFQVRDIQISDVVLSRKNVFRTADDNFGSLF